ncbi:MAG: MFS transporter [Dehalococcoidia bacterium]|nr:MFS transporter [Dehalococcoidia bacterium]
MERNLRILPWWWVVRWAWLGEGVWVIYLLEERGLTIGQVLLFEALYSAVIIVTELPSGMVSDRFGRRISLVLGSMAAVAGMLAFGAGASLLVLLAAYAFLALAESSHSGADTSMLYDSLKATGRDQRFTAWHGRLNAVIALSIGGFTVVGSLMTNWVPLWVPIVLSGALSAPAIVLAWVLHEPPRQDERHPYLQTGVRAVQVLLRSRAMLTVTGLMTVTTLAIALMGVLQQRYLLDAGVPVWGIGLFVAGQMGLAAVGSWMAEPVGRWLPLRHIFWAMPALSAVSLVAAVSGNVWLYPLFIFPSFGWNVMFPHVTDYLARRVTDSLRSTLMSASNMISAVCNIGFVSATGLAIDRTGMTGTLIVVAAGLLAAVAFLYLAWLRAGDLGRPVIDASPPADVPWP